MKQDMRTAFAQLLFERMEQDKNIWLITGDLGYVLWDKILQRFPNRFLNTGAAEQAMMGIAVGLAQSGKVPVVYSITPFLLYRPFETIRNYLNEEKASVKLVGSGRNMDYENEGFSHWANEDKKVMKLFPNIQSRWPQNILELKKDTESMLYNTGPYYLNLARMPR